jgi:hypothetical protein
VLQCTVVFLESRPLILHLKNAGKYGMGVRIITLLETKNHHLVLSMMMLYQYLNGVFNNN